MTQQTMQQARCLGLVLLGLAGGFVAAGGPAAHAQGVDVQSIQAGVAVIPGFGLQAGYVGPRSFYTVEGLLYVDGSPRFAGGEGSVQLSAALGGALRIFGIIRTISSPASANYDVDVGLRFGPSLFFSVNESRADKNQRFSLFLEPFARFSTPFRGRIAYVELGLQRPLLRAGLLFKL